MNKERPINLDIKTINLPITAVVSILHRISSVILWASMAIFLPAVYFSLLSEKNFDSLVSFFSQNPLGQFMVWGLLSAFGYYMCATVKHITQDFGHFEELESGKKIALSVAILAGCFCIVSGIWVWA